ncbi:SDR family NAD(P)-dependent oxidoreductase [Sphingosinicella terrae]|jgi:NAD(P)-dependent dehydrogenase (short-subunit alcohol dehydrogenase family)|uniref:SDR family NAD(P)-dependent oxidoreductase n=1 Tax=Sphingosinicella terrae TaxID=2172047 RepID=UPI000E0D2504|nr:SDR family oxidoreductase [Sphingosinicella terrae]
MTRIALITGASRGLGRAMALHLADTGVDIIGTFRSRRDEADGLVAELEARGRRAAMLPLDVGDASRFGVFAEAVKAVLAEWFGRDDFDYLVNNAGLGHNALFAEMEEAAFDELVQVHLKGPLFLTQKLLPLIADGGRILNVSSGLTRFAFPGYGAYAAAKGAVEVLTRYMALELGPRGIRVNVLAPGAIATDFGGGAVRDNEALNAQVRGGIALGRVGEADDIGGAVAAILSDGFGWANGARIEVSGGQLL